MVGGDKLSFEKLVRCALGVTCKNQVCISYPACRVLRPIILSCHPDYLKLIEKVNHMENIDIKQNSNKGFVCSICRDVDLT